LKLLPNFKYNFNLSDSSNSGHIFSLSTGADGIWGNNNTYTGVSSNELQKVGTDGDGAAYLIWDTPNGVNDSMYYYCSAHALMGGVLKMTGSDGTYGADGTDGGQGYQGYQGQGYQGYQGNVGSHGGDGAQGYQGNDGTDGAQGYQGGGGPEVVFSADENTSTYYDFTDNTTNCSSEGCPLWHKADIDNELIDTASDYDVSASRFTPTTAGKYKLHAKIGGSGIYSSPNYGGGGKHVDIRIVKNASGTAGTTTAPTGTIIAENFYTAPDAGHIGHASVETEGIGEANGSSDYFEVWFRFKNVIYSHGTTQLIDAAFDGFLINQGATGSQGHQGDAGSNGGDGAAGAAGAAGAQGNQGFQGDAGAAGSNGGDGAAGATGPQGNQGFQGDAGAAGSNGSDGAAGAAGPQGNQGFQGDAGAAGSNGSDGAAGAAGPQGNQGFQGDAGADAWSSGIADPTGGSDGDFYFETDTDKIWKKASGSWSEIADLTGGAISTTTEDLYTAISSDSYYGDVSAMLHFEGANGATSTEDDSIAHRAVSMVGTAQLSTTQKKFGSSSLLLDGDSDYVSLANSSDFDFGTGDFTIECWFYYDQATAPQYATIFDRGDGSGGGFSPFWLAVLDDSGLKLVCTCGTNGGQTNVINDYNLATITDNTWHHVAFTRHGSNFYVYLDGVSLSGAAQTDSDALSDHAYPVLIGARGQWPTAGYGVGSFWGGYIDESRITKSLCRYPSGTTFTPSTTGLPGESRFQQTVVTSVTGGGVAAVTAVNNPTANELVTVGSTTTELDAEANLTFDGSLLSLTGNLHTSVHDYGTTADINVDLNEDALQKALLNGNVAIDTAAANKGAGKSIVIKILCDGTARNFTWNSSWIFIGEKPTSIAASKTAILSMTCFGTAETDIVCSYAVQD
jgi:hypothetical protein